MDRSITIVACLADTRTTMGGKRYTIAALEELAQQIRKGMPISIDSEKFSLQGAYASRAWLEKGNRVQRLMVEINA